MEEFPVVTRRGSGLSTEQKVALVLLLFLGLGGVIFGFKSFGANIRRPFEAQLARSSDAGYLTPTEQEAKELEASKSRDTDKDGLNDYDEQEVFKTSAFLADTDSDGFDDKTEVFSGNDPNCPADKDCGRSIVEGVGQGAVSPEGLLEQISDNPLANILSGGAAAASEATTVVPTTQEELVQFLDSFSAQDIREVLIQSGVTTEELDQIDDETLQSIFNDAVQQATASGELTDLLKNVQPEVGSGSGSQE